MIETDKKVPAHVGIIMDGNGRWAKAKGKKRTFGHRAGSKNVDRIVTHAFKAGVTTLSLYAFSCENWERPKEEVDGLMDILRVYFKKFIGKIVKNGIRLSVMGDVSVLPNDLQEIIKEDIEKSSCFTEKNLNIAINYGGRQEIVKAVNNLINKGEKVTVESISKELYTSPFKDPDLIIRTGGEKRLSNFMLYQSAYSELYFTDVLWPDFDATQFDKALEVFSKRERRFGGIGE